MYDIVKVGVFQLEVEVLAMDLFPPEFLEEF